MDDLAKLLVLVGLGIAVAGGALFAIARLTGGARLPGDLSFNFGNATCLVPIATSIILSLVLTVVLNIVLRVLNR
jgi:hypothetical protein